MGTNPTCSEIGDDNGRKIDIQDVPNSTYNTGDFDGSNSVTVSNSGLDNGQYLFDWTSTFGVDTVIVKQSDDAHNVYEYGSPDFGDTGLGPHPGQNQGGISHVDFCYDDPPTTGQLTIVKISDPRDGTDFSFNFSNPTQTDIPFTLDDASPDDNDGKSETKVFSDLPPGLYKVTETVTSGRTLDSVVCVPSDHTSGITNGADVNLVAGDDITCTFTNTKDPTTAKLTIVRSPIPRTAPTSPSTSQT